MENPAGVTATIAGGPAVAVSTAARSGAVEADIVGTQNEPTT